MKVNKYVQLAFAIAGIIAWVLIAKFFTFLFDVMAPDWNVALLGPQFRIADLIGLLGGTGVWLYLKMDERIVTLAKEVATELSKVTWPSAQEVKTSTIAVVAASLLIALVLGFFDYVWGLVTAFLYKA